MIDFEKCFELLSKKPKDLTGNPPFEWQTRLYERFLADDIPKACDIPTGLGKTSVIVIWLLALATKLIEKPEANQIPRRLIYVVDRRVIVDQATKEAEDILFNIINLKDSDDDIKQIYEAFKDNSFFIKDDKKIIALSTLRGEYADNREWCLDPSRPAIIVGTIDMIGSRLLFSAYGGVGESYKALQAGLLGQDALIAVDEMHLSPAFVKMLRTIPNLIDRKEIIKPFEIMMLSATLDEDNPYKPDEVLSLGDEDLANPVAKVRLNAEKHIKWESFSMPEEILKSKKGDELLIKEQAKEMAKVAAQYKDSTASVLVFGTRVKLVKEIKEELTKTHGVDEKQILVMVGGMRGHERDNLSKPDSAQNQVFKQFDPNRTREEQTKSHFLIATSCAEVGVNLDADYAVCDLTSADSFIQRLGRVNRLGKTTSTVTIVYENSLDKVRAEAKATFDKLREPEIGENFNASPLALRNIKFPSDCYPEKPVSPPLDSARIDDWAMTSLKQNDFRRPLVSYWLRGLTENKASETSLCWRADLRIISKSEQLLEINENDDRKVREKKNKTNDGINKRIKKRLISAVKTVPVKSRECARETTPRAQSFILNLPDKFSDYRVVLLSPTNDYEVYFVNELKKHPDLRKMLTFATVILPCEIGGLDKDGIVVETTETQPVDDLVETPDKKTLSKNGNDEDEKLKPEWLRVILTKKGDEVTVKKMIQKENLPDIQQEDSFENLKDGSFNKLIAEIAKAEDRISIKTIDLGNSTETDEDEEEKTERKLCYLIAKKSPEAYLPNDADDNDENDNDSSSIGIKKDEAKKFDGQVTVEAHNDDVARYAKNLASKLHLDSKIIEALEIAGSLHDNGKARQCWQSAVGNFNFDVPLAKSNQGWFNNKYNRKYRHEFGSLIEAENNDTVNQNPNRELILHLIATHHGYARPHFPERAFDRENPLGDSRDVAERAMLRFANLQIKYGWWQLAYLEAILKAADALASRAEAEGRI